MRLILGDYTNGNIHTVILSDGTKIREVKDTDDFIPDFPETMDVNISQYCANNCPMCYAGCSTNGKHADLKKYEAFLESVHPYTELAINLNSEWNPGLLGFLKRMRDKKVIVNATILQKDFMEKKAILKGLCEEHLLWGIGVSLEQTTSEFIKAINEFPNAIVHVINGIITPADLKALSDQNIKMLILGYKQTGRGVDWYSKEGEEIQKKQMYLFEMLPKLSAHFPVISFDNLSVEQLAPGRLISKDLYEERFLGEDGTMSFYINLVDGYFALNSLSDMHFSIGEKTVDECFQIVRKVCTGSRKEN